MSSPVIVWFRQDLRLSDNPALHAAAATGAPVLPVFILDDDAAGDWKPGSASRWWLRKSLAGLDESLGGALRLLYGEAGRIIPELASDTGATAVYWNRCVEPWRVDRDADIKSTLLSRDIEVHTFNGSYMYDPAEVRKQDGTPYRVFTPFYRKGCLENGPEPRAPLPAPPDLQLDTDVDRAHRQSDSALTAYSWFDGGTRAWEPGEAGARRALERFIELGLEDYAEGRDRPDRENVSYLSPHLRFGELSPQQARAAVLEQRGNAPDESIDKFLSELGWRDFSAHLLLQAPDLPERNLQKKFDRFPWLADEKLRKAWETGKTGYPIVDAGMRELWRTGYMHNRVRMIAASFLVKNLLQDWRHGERWFWNSLLDADLANNAASWQWVAGCGADAAPYFRIFNPVTQGKKFDPVGDYVRRHVPEIAGLPDKFVHCPWEAPTDVLEEAGVELGKNYPAPIVDLAESRQRALDAYATLS
jgi:deoxyribodipyrimidine photo-lyase